MGLIADRAAHDPVTAAWGNAIRDQGVQVTTSSARPSSPAEGMVIYETDTDRLMMYTGSAWVEVGRAAAGTSWTPTFKIGTSAQTLTNVDAKYTMLGRWCAADFSFELSTASGSGTLYIGNLPATPRAYAASLEAYMRPIGQAGYMDVSSGYTRNAQLRYEQTSGQAYLSSTADDPATTFTGVTPVAIAAGDEYHGSLLFLT